MAFQDHTIRRLYLCLRRLHLAVPERSGELELRGLEMELVDHGAHAVARNGVSSGLSTNTQAAGEEREVN
jgi:hypothetical protein